MKVKIQNSIWPAQNGGPFYQKSMDCTKNQGTLVSWIADSKNETKNTTIRSSKSYYNLLVVNSGNYILHKLTAVDSYLNTSNT